jgi:hypothetical protein
MDMDELQKSMSEGEMALFIAVTMLMYSVIEMGANQQTLLDRLSTHEANFSVLRNPKASGMMAMLKAMVKSTQGSR